MGQLVFATAVIYLVLGVAFAVYFVTSGVARMDLDAKEAPVSFKVLIMPASVALWPLLTYKLIRHKGVQ